MATKEEKATKEEGKVGEDELAALLSALEVKKHKKKKPRGATKDVGPQKGPKWLSTTAEDEPRGRDMTRRTSSRSR